MDNQNQFNLIKRISLGSNNIEANNNSRQGTGSADSKYITFVSTANNLVADDNNNFPDIFVYDRSSKSTARVSLDSNGIEANSFSQDPAISADGRYITFTSDATNLVLDDLNKSTDIFLYDRQSQKTQLISVDSNGIPADWYSFGSSISNDGRHIVFESNAENLVTDDNNQSRDIFIHDRELQTTELISVATNGNVPNDRSQDAAISSDARYIVFESDATNLVANDTNNQTDIFVYDRIGETTELVSLATDNQSPSNGASFDPAISDDGRYVAFESRGNNLVANDTNGRVDIFLRDRQLQTTRRVSLAADGTQANGDSAEPSMSAYGRYITFESKASNLVANDTNNLQDQFVFDLAQGSIKRINLSANGTQANSKAEAGTLTADGQTIIFNSKANNLVSGDSNNASDIFAKQTGQLLGEQDLNNLIPDQVHRFYNPNNATHFYTADDNEIETIRAKSEAGELPYQYEAAKFAVLQDNINTLTGAMVEGIKPIYRFFNTETGSHLYTGDENEREFIQENFGNYSFEGINYYAFESPPENIDTLPVYRFLNNVSGSHFYTTERQEFDYIQANLPHFALENNGEAAFHVLEL